MINQWRHNTFLQAFVKKLKKEKEKKMLGLIFNVLQVESMQSCTFQCFTWNYFLSTYCCLVPVAPIVRDPVPIERMKTKKNSFRFLCTPKDSLYLKIEIAQFHGISWSYPAINITVHILKKMRIHWTKRVKVWVNIHAVCELMHMFVCVNRT